MRSYFWSVFSCIQSEYRNIRTRYNSVFGHFLRSERFKDSNSATVITAVIAVKYNPRLDIKKENYCKVLITLVEETILIKKFMWQRVFDEIDYLCLYFAKVFSYLKLVFSMRPVTVPLLNACKS